MPTVGDNSSLRSSTPPQRPPPPGCIPRRNHSESPSFDRHPSNLSRRSSDVSTRSHDAVFSEGRSSPYQRSHQQHRRRRSGVDIRQTNNAPTRGRRRPEITIISAQPMSQHPAFADGNKGGYVPPEAPPSYEQAMRSPMPLNPTFTDPTMPDHIPVTRRADPEAERLNNRHPRNTRAPEYQRFATPHAQPTHTVTSSLAVVTSQAAILTRTEATTSSQIPLLRTRNVNHSNNQEVDRASETVTDTHTVFAPTTSSVAKLSQQGSPNTAGTSRQEDCSPGPSTSDTGGSGSAPAQPSVPHSTDTKRQKPALPKKKPVLRPNPRNTNRKLSTSEDLTAGRFGASNCDSNPDVDVVGGSASAGTNQTNLKSDPLLGHNGTSNTVTTSGTVTKQFIRSNSQSTFPLHHIDMSSPARPPVPASRQNRDVMSLFEGEGTAPSSGLPTPLLPTAGMTSGGISNGEVAPPSALISPLTPTHSAPQGGSPEHGKIALTPTGLPPALVPIANLPQGVSIDNGGSNTSIDGLQPTTHYSSTNGPQGVSLSQPGRVKPTHDLFPPLSPQHILRTDITPAAGNTYNGSRSPITPSLSPQSVPNTQSRKLPPPPRPSSQPKTKSSQNAPTSGLSLPPSSPNITPASLDDFGDEGGYASIQFQSRPPGGVLSPTKSQGGALSPAIVPTHQILPTTGNSANSNPSGVLTPIKLEVPQPQNHTITAPVGPQESPGSNSAPIQPNSLDLLTMEVAVSGATPSADVLSPDVLSLPTPIPRKTTPSKANEQIENVSDVPPSEPVYAAVVKKKGNGDSAPPSEQKLDEIVPRAGTSLDVLEPTKEQVMAAELAEIPSAAPPLPTTRPPLEDFEDLLSPADMSNARNMDGSNNSFFNPNYTPDPVLSGSSNDVEDLLGFGPLVPANTPLNEPKEPTTGVVTPAPRTLSEALEPDKDIPPANLLNDKLHHVPQSNFGPMIAPPRNKSKVSQSGVSSDSSGKNPPPLPATRPTGSEGSTVVCTAPEPKELHSPEATLVLRKKSSESEESFTKKLRRKSVKIKNSMKVFKSTPQKQTESGSNQKTKKIEAAKTDQTTQDPKQSQVTKPASKPPRPSGPPPRPSALPTKLSSPALLSTNKTPSPVAPTQPGAQTPSPKVRPAKPPPPKLTPQRAAPARPEPRRNSNQNNRILEKLLIESPEKTSNPTSQEVHNRLTMPKPAEGGLLDITSINLLSDEPVQQPAAPTPKPRSNSKRDSEVPIQPIVHSRPGPPVRPAPTRAHVRPTRPPPAVPVPKSTAPSVVGGTAAAMPPTKPMRVGDPAPVSKHEVKEVTHPQEGSSVQQTQRTSICAVRRPPPVPLAKATKSTMSPQGDSKVPQGGSRVQPNAAVMEIMESSSSDINPQKPVALVSELPEDTVLVTALFDFNSTVEDELSFHRGDKINFISEVNDNWLKGKIGDKVGIFPKNFIQFLQQKQPQQAVVDNAEQTTAITDTTLTHTEAETAKTESISKPTFTTYPTRDNKPEPASAFPESIQTDKTFVTTAHTEPLPVVTSIEKDDLANLPGDLFQTHEALPGGEVDGQHVVIATTPPSDSQHNSATPSATTTTSRRMSTALFDFTGQDDSELTFKGGDVITITGSVNEDWLTGELAGQTGIFPAAFVEEVAAPRLGSEVNATFNSASSEGMNTTNNITSVSEPTGESLPTTSGGQFVEPMATATRDYTAPSSDEISFKTNDTLYLLDMVDGEWFTAQHDGSGAVGKVPRSHIKVNHPLPDGGNQMNWIV